MGYGDGTDARRQVSPAGSTVLHQVCYLELRGRRGRRIAADGDKTYSALQPVHYSQCITSGAITANVLHPVPLHEYCRSDTAALLCGRRLGPMSEGDSDVLNGRSGQREQEKKNKVEKQGTWDGG